MNRFVRWLLPRPIRSALKKELRALKTPEMVYGYRDPLGNYRPLTRISDSALLIHPENIQIADNVFVGHYNIIDGVGGVRIGEGTQFAANVCIFTHSSHIAIRLYGRHYQGIPECEKKGYAIAPVNIGRYVYVGAGANIFSGVTLADGALVYAGAFVTKDVAEYQIVAGCPAKVIGDTRELDKPYLNDPQLLEWYNEWQEN